MLTFLAQNIANIIIIAAVVLVASLIVARMVRNKRKGISDCAGCTGCSAADPKKCASGGSSGNKA